MPKIFIISLDDYFSNTDSWDTFLMLLVMHHKSLFAFIFANLVSSLLKTNPHATFPLLNNSEKSILPKDIVSTNHRVLDHETFFQASIVNDLDSTITFLI